MIEGLHKRVDERQKQLQNMVMTRSKLESQLAQVNEGISQLHGAIFELNEMIKLETDKAAKDKEVKESPKSKDTLPAEKDDIQEIVEEKKQDDAENGEAVN